MTWWKRLLKKEAVEREMDAELRSHWNRQVATYVRRGMTEAEAQRAARLEFGGLEQIKEDCRDARGTRWVESAIQDVRYAARLLAKSPAFTLVAVLTLALGIGANAGIFSVINAVLLRPLPYPNPDQLVLLFERDVVAEGGGPNVVSFSNFLDWQEQSASFTALAAARENLFNLGGDGTAFLPERIEGALCSESLFRTLGVQPALGRSFSSEEDRPGAPRVVVISHGLWQRRFGGAPDILHRQARLGAENYGIVGVMPPGFAYPHRGIDVWVPVQQVISGESRTNRASHQFYVVARLRPGVSREQALSEMNGIAGSIRAEHPGQVIGRGASLFSLAEWGTRRSRTTLLVLFAAVGCVLLITCLNIVNLLRARGSQRRRELAVRAALGAGRGRILRQLLTESTLLALLGAGLGLVLAYGLTTFLGARASILLSEFDIDTSAEIRLDRWVFLFTAGVAVLAGLGTGVFPAWQLVQSCLTGSLKEGGRSGTATRAHQHFRNILVMSEVALSLVLLVTAGLLLRSFDELRRVHPGARADHLLTVGVSLPKARYAKREQVAAFSQQLLGRLEKLPGVRSAGLVSCLPVAGYCGDGTFHIEGRPLPPGQFNLALDRDASPGYFTSAGIPLLRGRTFTAQDGRGFDDQHPRDSAVVISESMAREFWPNVDALGQRIYFGSARSARYQIVGIVGDVLIHLDEKAQPTMYLPLLEGARTDFYAAVHTVGDPAALAPDARREISSLDPDIPAYRVRTMSDILGQSGAQRQFIALLLGLFAALALVLAAIGLYGVLSYSVAQRTAEIGIRMALGATERRIWRLVLVDGMRPALLGAILGMIGAVGATRFLQSLLFGVSHNDLVTFVSVPVVLLVVALLACSFPAWRATGVEPAAALRSE